MSGKKERMQPQHGHENKISMYCCGVTVYDLSHIGDMGSLDLLLNMKVPILAAILNLLPLCRSRSGILLL